MVIFGLKSFIVAFMEPTEVVYGVADEDVAVVVEPVEVVVDAVPVDVQSIGAVVGAFPVVVVPVDVVVNTVAALLVVALSSLFRVKPTLNPIVSATTAKPSTPSGTKRLRRVDLELNLALSYNGSARIRVRRNEYFAKAFMLIA